MWFGDLVTMTWWDDLWLNESFAEYMAYRAVVEVTEFTDAWVEFGVIRKLWGYAAERAPSTHPVAGSPAPDALSALGNFDGISYAKGASVIRQLIAHIGDEAFVAGVVEHLRSHAYGNGDLAQFLAAMEAASGRSLDGVEPRRGSRPPAPTGWPWHDGVLTRTPPAGPPRRPPAHPRRRRLRGWARAGAGRRGRRGGAHPRSGPRRRCPTGRSSCRTPATSPGRRCRLDPATVAALPAGLADVPDAQARAVLWVALLGAVHRAEVDPRTVLDVFAQAWPRETSSAVLVARRPGH